MWVYPEKGCFSPLRTIIAYLFQSLVAELRWDSSVKLSILSSHVQFELNRLVFAFLL